MDKKRYCIGIKDINESQNSIYVKMNEEFNKKQGYGFLSFTKEEGQEKKEIFYENGGWIGNNKEEELSSEAYPIRFRALVADEGNYSVKVKLIGSSASSQKTNIYSGRRNLVRRDITLEIGEEFTTTFHVHVGAYIPVMGKPAQKDLSIYVSVFGQGAELREIVIEKAQVPTLFIGGDSIVADYLGFCPYNPLLNGGAWGQYLLQYVKNIAIDNQAHGGMTTNCFRDDGHWDIIQKRMKPGDIFMFQFGHNDQKRRNLAPFGDYSTNLRWYIQQVRKLGGYPIIVTSLSRIPNKNQQGYYDLLEDYAMACKRVGREWDVPVIDLHKFSFDLFCNMDKDRIKGYFNDAAHTNDYGAMLVADFIGKEIEKQKIEPLASYLVKDVSPLWTPDESLRPMTQISPIEKPELPILSTKMIELPYVDCRHIQENAKLKEAMSKNLLDPCLKFFHPFMEMPRGQFLYVFFKAYKVKKYSSYKGKYCDIYRYEFDANNVQAAIDEKLIDEMTTMNDRFRPDEGITGIELVSFIIRALHQPGDREYNLLECEQQGRSLGLLWEGYERNKKVTRVECISALVDMMNLSSEEVEGLGVKRKIEDILK